MKLETPYIITLVYLLFTWIRFQISFTLSSLNMGQIHKNKNKIPPYMQGRITQEEYSRSQKYSLQKEKFGIFSMILSNLFLLILIYSGFLGWIDSLVAQLELSVYWQGILYLISLSLIMEILDFPISFYKQFVIEEEYGFNRMTLKLYIIDQIKQAVLSLLLMLPLLAALYWFLATTGEFWWLFAWGAYILFQWVLFFLYPVAIAPLFNRFTPLEEGELKDRLNQLAERTGFTNQGIFMMDGSKRSAHSNAYFTGIGKFRRIVLFDTLVEQLDHPELEAVLAHEIGHFKKKHVLKSMIASTLMMGLSFFILHLLKDWEPLYSAFRFTRISIHGLLVVLMFCSSPFTFLFTPLSSARSRKHEFQADSYSKEIMGTGEPLIAALLKLGQKNLSNLTPHRLYSQFYYSHPTIEERRKALFPHEQEPQEEE